MNSKRTQTAFEEIVIRSWWIPAFVLICYTVYEQASISTQRKIDEMRDRITSLELSKAVAIERQEELMVRLAAREDPYWIELTLVRVLGLIPRGQTKVIFLEAE